MLCFASRFSAWLIKQRACIFIAPGCTKRHVWSASGRHHGRKGRTILRSTGGSKNREGGQLQAGSTVAPACAITQRHLHPGANVRAAGSDEIMAPAHAPFSQAQIQRSSSSTHANGAIAGLGIVANAILARLGDRWGPGSGQPCNADRPTAACSGSPGLAPGRGGALRAFVRWDGYGWLIPTRGISLGRNDRIRSAGTDHREVVRGGRAD